MKPTGGPAYGSIGHIHGSRLGPGDHHVHIGQSAICTTAAPPGKRVTVQAKLDGSCVAVAKLGDGTLVAIQRKGYDCRTSPFEQHHLFADYVDQQIGCLVDAILDPGERLVGEWLAMAHGTRYDLRGRDPFVPFDIMRGKYRVGVDEFYERTGSYFWQPCRTDGPMLPEVAMDELDHYGAEQPEGVVYRVESAKGYDFLAKWVRPDKVDGAYFDDETWNWRPS